MGRRREAMHSPDAETSLLAVFALPSNLRPRPKSARPVSTAAAR